MAKFARLDGNPHSQVTVRARRQSRFFLKTDKKKGCDFVLPTSWNPYDRRDFNCKLETGRDPRSEPARSKGRDPRSEKSRYQSFRNYAATYPGGAMVQAVGCNRIGATYGQSAVTIPSDLCPLRSQIPFF